MVEVENVDEIRKFAASSAQNRIWLHQEKFPNSRAYVVVEAFRLCGNLDGEALDRAIIKLVSRYHQARASFETKNGKLIQTIAPFKVSDFIMKKILVCSDEVSSWLRKEAAHKFDLSSGPLFRSSLLKISETEHILVFCCHHIITDGQTSHLLLQALSGYYRSECGEHNAKIDFEIGSYQEFVKDEQLSLNSKRHAKEMARVLEHFNGSSFSIDLPIDASVHDEPDKAQILRTKLPDELVKQIEACAIKLNSTPFMIYLTAYYILLSRYSGEQNLVTGIPYSGRICPSSENGLGLFVNTIPVLCTLNPDDRCVDIIERVKAETLRGLGHGNLPIDQVVANMQGVPLSTLILMKSENGPVLDFPNIKASRVFIENQHVKSDLILKIEKTTAAWFGSENFVQGTFTAIEYPADRISKHMITQMLSHYRKIIIGIVESPEKLWSNINLVTKTELAVQKKSRKSKYDIELLDPIAKIDTNIKQLGDKTAIIHGSERITYEALGNRISTIQTSLLKKGIKKGDFVGVCLQRNPDLIASLIAVLRCGAAYVPLDPNYPQGRLEFIVSNANCVMVLVDSKTLELIPNYAGDKLTVNACLKSDVLPQKAMPSGGATAYLIYTSGSTGIPKGVMISYKSLQAFLGWSLEQFSVDDLREVLAATSICFDLSIFEIFSPLCVGGSLRLVENAMDLAFAENMTVSLINTVPSIMSEILKIGNLPETTCVVNLAGEALTRKLSDRVFSESADIKLYNLYGPSEDTTYSTFAEVKRNSSAEPTIGEPLSGSDAFILDDNLNQVPVGVRGQLYLGGHGLSQGYLRRPALTAEKFIPNFFSREPGSRLYGTGDIVKLNENGELEYFGREDDQVKLRGFRIETGEIEKSILMVKGVSAALVICRKIKGQKYLIGYWTGNASSAAIREYISLKIPDYMMPSFWVNMIEFPLNSNGKIDRRKLPDPDPDFDTEMQTGDLSTETEVELAKIFAKLLKKKVVLKDQDFFKVGGHSLLAMQLLNEVRTLKEIDFSLLEVFKLRSIKEISRVIDSRNTLEAAHKFPTHSNSTIRETELSYGQKRMWLVQQLRPNSSMLNVSVAVRFEGILDVDILRQAIQSLTENHAALRLRFKQTQDGIFQYTVDNQVVPLQVEIAATENDVQNLLLKTISHPFDLRSQAPVRWLLIKQAGPAMGGKDNVLCLVIHHSVIDAWSLRLLLVELHETYAVIKSGKSVAKNYSPSIIDYAAWQRKELAESQDKQTSLQYWVDELSAPPERLQLPFDYPPKEASTYKGARLSKLLETEKVDQLIEKYCVDGFTPFMTMMALYQAFLSRITGQKDVVVGTPFANRDIPGTEEVVGCLLNTVAFRADLSEDISFSELIKRTRTSCLKAFQHQSIPFELVLETIDVSRSVEHTPLFQTMFVLDSFQENNMALPGLKSTVLEVPNAATQYDITLVLFKDKMGWKANWFYREDLFQKSTIESINDSFITFLENVRLHSKRPINHLSLCKLESKPESKNPYLKPKPLLSFFDLFIEQATANKNELALQDDQGVLTYEELLTQVYYLSDVLTVEGVKTGDIVSINSEKNRNIIVSMLAVSSLGATFLLLDSALPKERRIWISKNSDIKFQLSESYLRTQLDSDVAPILLIGQEINNSKGVDTTKSVEPVNAKQPAYVIYTSGSTGTPKGVMLSHAGLTQLRDLHKNHFDVGVGSHVLQYSPYSFDAVIWECVMALTTGACLHLTHAENLLPGAPLEKTINDRGITHLTIPPSNLMMLDELPKSLEHLVLAGEPFPVDIIKRWGDRVHLWNAYGPSEATVCTTVKDCQKLDGSEIVSIGKAFPGAQAYVLDDALNLLPPHVLGELYLGGDGIAYGYLGDPVLTARKFVPNPFSEKPGDRIYATGDLARLTSTGEIEFQGRKDTQIKLRGIRVELGEIENSILRIQRNITNAVVLAIGEEQEKRLVAYFTATEAVDTIRLRQEMAANLPNYMLPAWMDHIEEFPLTMNGKLDRKLLTQRALNRRIQSRTINLPRGKIELDIADLWKKVLSMEEIARDDSFFSVGGTSLSLTLLHTEIDKQFPDTLRLIDLFNLNTVADIAKKIESITTPNNEIHKNFDFQL